MGESNRMADTKYLPFADQYMGMAHGNGYEHLKRWLKNRLIFTDTLYDYAPSYNNDVLTIRANTTEPMTITIETYTPVYQHLSWYNNQMDKKKIDGKTAITFTGTAQTATDQEVLIYGGSNIKRITGISSMNPNSMLIGSATRLIELDVSNCPILATVNATGSNFTPHTYLNKLDISNCPNLTGTLRINNSPLLRELNAKGTGIDTLQLAPSLRNLEVLRLPNTVTELTLNDAGLLNTLEFDEGGNLQRISLSNCPGIANSNIDLTKVPTVLLDNSYDTQELYMSDTTNLTLKNMANLERVIYIPNNEYEIFEITTLTSSPDYSVTTFNCPRLTTFMTTAPHRESYNNNIELVEKVLGLKYIIQDIQGTNGTTMKYPTRIDFNTQYIEAKLDITNYQGSEKRLIGIGSNNEWGNSNTKGFDVFWHSTNQLLAQYMGGANNKYYTYTDTTNIIFKLTKDGFYINDTLIYDNSLISNVLSDTSTNIVCQSNAYYEYIKVINYETEIVQVKDYGDIKPNTTFTANSLDLSNTQFTDIKFLCTTDLYKLKVPTTMKNFYCDSAMDIDTNVIEDGSYEVIHDELIEQYTTDYSGEVVRYGINSKYMYADDFPYVQADVNTLYWSDYIDILPNSDFYITVPSDAIYMFEGYNNSKTKTQEYMKWGTTYSGRYKFTTDENTKYIRGRILKSGFGSKSILLELPQMQIPNIIPSSSDGSLIFSMYAPSKTVEPAVNTWDLYGLELKDFYTYGMNNDVKPSEGSLVLVNKNKELTYCYGSSNGNNPTKGSIYTDNGNLKTKVLGWLKIPKGNHTITTSNGKGVTPCWWSDTEGKMKTPGYAYASGSSYNWNDSNVTADYYECYLTIENTAEWVMIDNVRFNLDTIDNKGITGGTSDIVIMSNLGDLVTYNEGCENVLYDTPTSITMPKRYEPYSIQIKNANITPNNYPTMLYPLLINTTLPITGKLDYTKYNGTSLAWAYAYTTNDVTRLPLDSRHIGQITNEYNKLYGTDFVDIVDVWAYKDDDFTNKTTNENITKAYIELTSSNYKTRIDEVLQWYPNCTDLYLFDDGSVTSLYQLSYQNNAGNTIHRTQIENVTFVEGYFGNLKGMQHAFRGCTKLVTVNNIPASVDSIYFAFYNCSSLNCQLDFSNNTLLNSVNNDMIYVFYGCSSLTYPPILPSNYTGGMMNCFRACSSLVEAPVIPDGVTNLNDCFNGCSSLVEAPVIPEGVTAMRGTFDGCTSLTTIGNIPSSCNDYYHFAYNCTSLTSVPTDGWHGFMFETFYGCTSLNQQINITLDATRNSLEFTFRGCTSLSITPTLPTTANCSMRSCFQGCTSLVTPPVTPEGVTDMNSCYNGCTSLTTAPNIPASVTTIVSCFYNCTSLVEGAILHENIINIQTAYNGCTSLKKVYIPLSAGWVELNRPLNNCRNLEEVVWIGNRYTSYNVYDLINMPYNSLPRQSINDLIPEHLADLSTPWKLNINNKVYTFDDKYSATESRIYDTQPVLVGGRGTDELTGTMKLYEVTINNIKFIPILDTNGTPCMIRTDNNTCYYDTAGGTVVGGNSIGTYGDYTKLDYISFTDCYIKVSDITLDQSNHNITYLFRPIDGINTGFHIVNGVQCSNFNLNQYVGYIRVYCSAGFYLDLVDENGSPTVLRKSSATLTLGDYGAYLSPDEVFLANRKGWTIEGASNDFTIVNASDDVSGLTRDENITSCVIELTSSNYRTRIDEVLQWYPNCTDLYLFEDGSVTSLSHMLNNNNTNTKNQIVKIEFIEGYFSGVTSMDGTFQGCSSLTTAPNIPSGVTSMVYTFYNCSKLTTAPNIPSGVINMAGTFVNCNLLTTAPNIPSGVTDISITFQGCTSLTTAPNIPSGVINMNSTFKGCTSLTTVPNIPNSVTNIQDTFNGCTSLTIAPTIPNSVTNMSGTFRGCSKLTTTPTIPDSVTNMPNTFIDCTSLTTVSMLPNSVTNMDSTFVRCTSLTTVSNIPNSVTTMQSTFYFCSELTTVPNIPNTVTNMNNTFQGCTALTECTIPLTNLTNYTSCLMNCSALTNITWTGERTTDFSLTTLNAPSYTEADIKELVPEHLGTVTSATLTLGATYLAYLTEEEIASAVAKGWTLQ